MYFSPKIHWRKEKNSWIAVWTTHLAGWMKVRREAGSNGEDSLKIKFKGIDQCAPNFWRTLFLCHYTNKMIPYFWHAHKKFLINKLNPVT